MATSTRPDPDGRWETNLGTIAAHLAGDVPLGAIPDVDCKGLCVASCVDVPMTEPERARASRDLGENIVMGHDGVCNALDTASGRCQVYLNRPLVCRLYGGSEGLMCEFGCTLRSGQWLTYVEALAHLANLERRDGPASVRYITRVERARRARRENGRPMP